MDKNELRKKIEELFKQSGIIKATELHQPMNGMIMLPYISGPQTDQWFYEIKIINERYLSSHPLYGDINKIYENKTNYGSFEKMASLLKVLLDDDDF